MPASPIPNYADGLSAITDLSAVCLNNDITYICHDGDPGESADQKKQTNQNGNLLGSVTNTAPEEGNLALQLTNATDALPRPGYIIKFHDKYYVVGKVSPKYVQNDNVKFAVAVLLVMNPIVENLLTVDGQLTTKAWTISVAITAINCTTLNGAAGTYAWSLAAGTTAVPTGIAIGAATGIITGTPTVAGSYNFKVVATDPNGKTGFGVIVATVA